jgi:hypothetical protein
MVVSGEYHFPTTRGQNQVLAFDRLSMAGIQGLLDLMLDGVAAGSFVPTDEPKDCEYCDYRAVCRVRDAGFGKTGSPLAEWSREYLNTGSWPAFDRLRGVREFES